GVRDGSRVPRLFLRRLVGSSHIGPRPKLSPLTRNLRRSLQEFALCRLVAVGAMIFVVFAALALLARTSLADRGNLALELGGGAHTRVVKAHTAQELSEIKDQLRQLQERVDRLEAEQADEAAEVQSAHTTVQTNCKNCRTRKFRLYLAQTGAALTVGTVGTVASVLGTPIAGVAAGGGTAAVTSGMLVKYTTKLTKKYPCLKEKAKQEQMLADLKADIMKEIDARDRAKAEAELETAKVDQDESECVAL
ncbi:unnamed protein product, partial [Prorocentrum cordatum]